MIHLFTDFGERGPYVGEMEAVLARLAPEVPRVRLMSDAPAFDPYRSAYLLAALAARFRPGDVCLAVVDPGVGTDRRAVAVAADGVWFVGPDNGLFELVLRRAARVATLEIAWRPRDLSASFHGRDLFAPVAARLARGDRRGLVAASALRFPDWPDDLPEILWTDAYGNAVTGLRAASLPPDARLAIGDRVLPQARTFGDMGPGEGFWYANSMGLVEIAVNRGNARELLGCIPGQRVRLAGPGERRRTSSGSDHPSA